MLLKIDFTTTKKYVTDHWPIVEKKNKQQKSWDPKRVVRCVKECLWVKWHKLHSEHPKIKWISFHAFKKIQSNSYDEHQKPTKNHVYYKKNSHPKINLKSIFDQQPTKKKLCGSMEDNKKNNKKLYQIRTEQKNTQK